MEKNTVLEREGEKEGNKVNTTEKCLMKAQIVELLLEKSTVHVIMKEQCGRNRRTKVERQ